MPEDAGKRQDLTVPGRKRQSLTAPSLSLPELADRFMQSRRQGSTRSGRRLSPQTLRFYRMCLDGLLDFAARDRWPAPAELTRDHLRDFKHYLDTETHRWDGNGRRPTTAQASPGTVRHYLNVAKIFFNWCQDEDYLEDSPAQRFRLPSPDSKDVEPYRDDEVNAMLATCDQEMLRGNRFFGVRNKAIISVFIDTGLRLNELSEMKLSELDPQLQQVRVLGKGAKMRVVPLNGQARKALKLYLKEYLQPGGDAVWQTEDGRPLTHHGIRLIVDRLKARAGVRSEGSAHRFRHYFATRYLENGGDLNSLRLLLGHATLYMVLRYTKFVDGIRALAESKSYSPLDRLTRGDNHNRRDENWGWRQ
jgi:site-specific recombinase XerD